MGNYRRTIGLLAGIAIGSAVWTTPGALAAQPRACMFLPNDPKGPLPRTNVSPLIYRKILFKRDGAAFIVETFSDLAIAGKEHCFRWEVANATASTSPNVDELSWPVAGIRTRPLMPGDAHRDFNVRQEELPAVDTNNPVYAFENQTTPTRSWIPSPPAPSRTPSQTAPSYKTIRTQDLLPGLKGASEAILNRFVAVLSLERARTAPDIVQYVGYGNHTVQVVSSAAREGDRLRISITAAVLSPPATETRFGYPALAALQRTEPKQLASVEEAQRFLGALREATSESKVSGGKSSFQTSVDTGGNSDVFRIRQPVTITTGQERHCYMVSVYTPIPIGQTLQDCW